MERAVERETMQDRRKMLGLCENGRSDLHVSIVDVFPTVCELIGAKIPENSQGRSLLPYINGVNISKDEFDSAYCEYGLGGRHFPKAYFDAHKEEITNQCLGQGVRYFDLNMVALAGVMRMVRMGDYKLIYNDVQQGELYNLKNDPAEMNNLFDVPEYRDVRTRMVEKLLMWCLRVQDPAVLRVDNSLNPIERLWDRHHHYCGEDFLERKLTPQGFF